MKFSGYVGFWVKDVEVRPGIWESKIIERKYVGEILRNNRNLQLTNKQNPDLSINNQISILSDLYAKQNWHSICYVIWNGVKWTVDSVEVNYPRLTLNLGGLYHGNENKKGEITWDSL